MQQEELPRPFGLLLLCGLSFGIAVWNLLAAGQLLVMQTAGSEAGGLSVAVQHSLLALPAWARVFLIVAAVIKAGLLFVAAWGYFNFRRLGRVAGTAYAVVSLGESATMVAALDHPVGLTTFIGILFAVFTLLAIHGPFRSFLTR